MRANSPGHRYALQLYSPDHEPVRHQFGYLWFFKKVGEKFPGNQLPEHTGTNCQEVLRVLIDRCCYLYFQQPCQETEDIISLLRTALMKFERRAIRVKNLPQIVFPHDVEKMPPCLRCGHIFPHEHVEG